MPFESLFINSPYMCDLKIFMNAGWNCVIVFKHLESICVFSVEKICAILFQSEPIFLLRNRTTARLLQLMNMWTVC